MIKRVSIGKVVVNLIDCELCTNKTPFKQDLLKVVRDTNPYEYQGIIEEKNQYEYLYHLSDIRGNIVRWLPIKEGDSVLELEAECGAITGALLKLSENTTAFVDCATDAEIIAERFSNCKNFVVYAGSFEEYVKEEKTQYDWVVLKNPNMLKAAKSLCKNNGRVVFMTDNRCGLRNFSGEKESGETEFFTGVEGKTAKGFTFAGLRKLINISGFDKAQMFYPYPDYRFMKNLYSNARLPRAGELVNNEANLEDDKLALFSLKDAFDASCEDGSFQYYANSYLVVLGTPVSTEYARFSNDRAPEYAIFTTIEDCLGSKLVKKYPISSDANNHIRNIAKYYSLLEERYSGCKLSVNKCNLLDVGDKVSVSFEYVEGIELSKLLDICLQKNNLEGFYSLFDKYVSLIGYNETASITDLDVVFSNILVDKDEWTLIDYEWCKESSVPVKETAYRAIYCYLLEDKNRKKFNMDLILERLILSKEASEDIENDEISFQKKVTGKSLSLMEIRERLGRKSINPIEISKRMDDQSEIYKCQIYPGGSHGEFSEENSFFMEEAYKSEKLCEITAPVAIEDNVLRVDPLNSSCLITIKEAKLGECDFPIESKKYLVSNGKRLSKDTFVFSTNDPNLYFNMDGFIHNEDTFLYLNMEVIPLPLSTALAVTDNIKKLF